MTFTTFQNGSTSSTNNSTPVNQFTPNYNGFTGGYTPGFNGYPTNVPFGYVNPFIGGQAFHAPFNTFQGNGSYNGFYPTNFVNTFGSYPTGYTTGGQNFNGFSWPTSNWSWNTVPFNGFQNWYTPFGGYTGSYTPAFFGGYTGGYRNFGGYNGLGGYTPFNTWNGGYNGQNFFDGLQNAGYPTNTPAANFLGGFYGNAAPFNSNYAPAANFTPSFYGFQNSPWGFVPSYTGFQGFFPGSFVNTVQTTPSGHTNITGTQPGTFAGGTGECCGGIRQAA